MSHPLTAQRLTVIDAIESIAPDADLSGVAPDAFLGDEVDLDSMDLLNIAASIFERTGVDIPERVYTGFTTIDDFAHHLLTAGYDPEPQTD